MPELRKDPVMGRWVIIATERAKRPTDFSSSNGEKSSGGFCPFCEGNEEKTPGELLSFRNDSTAKNKPGWWVRVVPNKFPALCCDGDLNRTGEGMYDKMNGIGFHEVVIETPEHNLSMGDYDVKQVEEIIWAFRQRYITLSEDFRQKYILVFKNHKREAGASLDHPHSQIISLPIVPKRVKEEIQGSFQYYNFKERCVFCDIVRQEQRNGKRIVFENDDFVAISPFAARFPFEIWILPKRHTAHFKEIEYSEVAPFASILRDTLHRIKHLLNDPPYNFMLHTAPCNEPNAKFPHYHWHLEITPKLTKVAGFEWGTGFYINPMVPEKAAEFLRNESVPDEEDRPVNVQSNQ